MAFLILTLAECRSNPYDPELLKYYVNQTRNVLTNLPQKMNT